MAAMKCSFVYTVVLTPMALADNDGRDESLYGNPRDGGHHGWSMGIAVLVVNGHHSFCSYMGTMAAMKCLFVYTVVLTPWRLPTTMAAMKACMGTRGMGGITGGQWASQFWWSMGITVFAATF